MKSNFHKCLCVTQPVTDKSAPPPGVPVSISPPLKTLLQTILDAVVEQLILLTPALWHCMGFLKS
jgi:hypothetical protein